MHGHRFTTKDSKKKVDLKDQKSVGFLVTLTRLTKTARK